MRLRDLAKCLGGLVLAVVLLAWVLRGIDPRAIRTHLETVGVGWLILGLTACAVLNLGHTVFRVWRWRALLEPVRAQLPFRPLFGAVILGYMASWLVPGRLGEFVRPALIAGREKLPLGACLGSVLADRLLDGLAVILFFALGMLLTPLAAAAEIGQGLRDAALLLVLLVTAPIIVLLVASARRSQLERWLLGRGGAGPWLARTLLAFARGTEALTRPLLLARTVLHTVLAWLAILAGTWLGIRACGIDVTPGAVAVMLPLLALGIALPTPGGAGGFHLAMKFGLVRLFDVAEPAAVAAGLLVHLAIVIPTILLGVVLLLVDRIAFRDLLSAARQVRTLGRAAQAETPAPALERTP